MAGETKGKLVCIGVLLVLCAGCGLLWPKPTQNASQKQVADLTAKVDEGNLTIRQLQLAVTEQSQATTKAVAEKIDTLNQNTENHFNDLSENQRKLAESRDWKTYTPLIAFALLCVVLPSGPFYVRITLLVLACVILLLPYVLPLVGVLL